MLLERDAVEHLTGDRLSLRRRREPQPARQCRPGEDLVRPVGGGKEMAEAHHALGAPEYEVAGLVEAVVEGRDDPLLKRGGEVDEDVAAGDQVQLREGRVTGQVVPHENAQLAHDLVDAVAAVRLDEVPPPALLAQLAYDAVGVEALARSADPPLADVGAENLERARQGRLVHELEERDRERIQLLAS